MNYDTLSLFVHAVPLVFAAIFPVLNPIGSAILVLPFTTGVDTPTRRLIARKVAFYTFVVLTTVLFVGSHLLAFFGISIPVVQATGGLLLASMGWKRLTAEDQTDSDKAGASRPVAASLMDQTFYPFTFPMTVGPGSVAVTLTLSAHMVQDSFYRTLVSQGGALVGFFGLAATVYLSFAYTVSLLKRIGPSGTRVILRLMSFLILCIGAQISWSGIHALLLQVR